MPHPSGVPILWSPWRIGYVLGGRPKGCVFCAARKSTDDAATFVLHRGRRAFVLLNRYPYNTGHLMVCPNRHVVEPSDLDREESLEVMDLVGRSADLLRARMKAQGVNVGINLGQVSGGSVDHLHVHLVPRWIGDTNFMPVVGGTKTLIEMLEGTYERLRRGRPFPTDFPVDKSAKKTKKKP